MTTQRLYTIAEAAPLLGMAELTLRDRVGKKAGSRRIDHLRVHGTRGVRFTAAQIEAYLASCAVTTAEEPAEAVPAALAALAGITLAGRSGSIPAAG